jgi:threonine dehydrogenase-like Zn-dependent dehydrogenase
MGSVVIGAAPTHKPEPLVFDMTRFYRYHLRMAAAASTNPANWKAAMRIMNDRTDELAKLVTHCFPLSRWEDAFAVTRDRKGFKAMITFAD